MCLVALGNRKRYSGAKGGRGGWGDCLERADVASLCYLQVIKNDISFVQKLGQAAGIAVHSVRYCEISKKRLTRW